MMGHPCESMAHQRTSPRWKEWIPLISQQLRLRNLIQVVGYNVNYNVKLECDNFKWSKTNDEENFYKKTKVEKNKPSYYYTLHLTTMSAPFYTSEKLENENPKWAEIEVCDLVNNVNAAVNGIVVRLWLHRDNEKDHVITVWGVYFSGLVYLGPKLISDPASFCINSIVFHMQGGYFTASESLRETTQVIRNTKVKINTSDIRPSYTVNLLMRLHTVQQAIKKQMVAAQNLREKISIGGFTASETRESAMLRRLLNTTYSRAPQRQEILKTKKKIETIKFRISVLAQEKLRKQAEILKLEQTKNIMFKSNQSRASELSSKYKNLYRDIEHLKDWRKSYIDTRESFVHTYAQLVFRRKQLMSELSLIYPVLQKSDNTFTIGDVYLPNAEDFNGHDEGMISVALGYVTHIVQMIAIFLQVPLRYPVIHFGSRSKIVDHISEKITDKDREFPLFSRGKDKMQFNYGVYLLNKNISQLLWYSGLNTYDLRATLPNLMTLLQNSMGNNLTANHRTLSGSSLDLRSSSQNDSPVGCFHTTHRKMAIDRIPKTFEKGHRVSKSMGSSELKFKLHSDSEFQSVKDFSVIFPKVVSSSASAVPVNSLSYSLDKGLDEYHDLKKVQNLQRPASASNSQKTISNLGHVGSEPILSPTTKEVIIEHKDTEVSSGDEAQRIFLKSWQEHGPAPVCSDDDPDILQKNRSNIILNSPVPLAYGPKKYDSVTDAQTKEFGETQLESSNDKPTLNGVFKPDSKYLLEKNVNELHENHLENAIALSKSSFTSDLVQTDDQPKSRETCTSSLASDNHAALSNPFDRSLLVDSMFVSVASRTEALANRSGSFNLVRSRHSSMVEDGHS